mmetsp:Transcript_8078/g.12496  ORF Transcript_8078/g.12496 Transcript_8078/m.12496 type:complete len:529 (-) Transcript_8078:73-1659(-)
MTMATSQEDTTVTRLSSPWEFNDAQPVCANCLDAFNQMNRRHHCRLCGKIFCGKCSSKRALLPPSCIVLVPRGGKQATQQQQHQSMQETTSFEPDQDPDRVMTILKDESTLLYGRGLEERFKLAREPLRVCDGCHVKVQPVQEELRLANSNAMRYNAIDPTDSKRLFNSPLAFTLGHEVRKAAYTLNNLLPQPKRMGAFVPSSAGTAFSAESQACKEQCTAFSPTLGDMDGVHIPARLLEEAKGVAVMTCFKGGMGFGVEVGTGLVVARRGDSWTAPCAIGSAGLSWGALIGAQVADHVFLLMTDSSVDAMFGERGNLTLGADLGVSVGPLGRTLEADLSLGQSGPAPIYTYSLSKGLYAGISLDGKVIGVRHWINEKFYGQQVHPRDILHGSIPTPPAAQPLYDALKRCDFYANNSRNRRMEAANALAESASSRRTFTMTTGYENYAQDWPANVDQNDHIINDTTPQIVVDNHQDADFQQPQEPPPQPPKQQQQQQAAAAALYNQPTMVALPPPPVEEEGEYATIGF